MLVTKRVSKSDPSKRSSTTRVMDNLGNHAFQILVAFAEIEAAETDCALAVVCVGFEYAACSFTLCSDYATHLSVCVECVCGEV